MPKIPNRRVVQAEMVDEDWDVGEPAVTILPPHKHLSKQANKPPQDTEPGGGTLDYGEGETKERQWVPGDPFYDDPTDPFSYDPSSDLDRADRRDDDDEDRGRYDDYEGEEDEDEDEEGEAADAVTQAYLSESGGYDPQFVPPWSPVPTAVGKIFVLKNKDAQIDIVFPTVYEEDRTAKLKDLATMQALDAITHRRMSEQAAKEMGFEQYTYDSEMRQIDEEKKKSEVSSNAVGIADELASTSIGLNVTPGGEMTPKSTKTPGPGGGSTGPQPIGAPAPAMAGERKNERTIGTPDRVTGPIDRPGQVRPEHGSAHRRDLSGRSTVQFKRNMRNPSTLAEANRPHVKRIVRDKNGLIVKIVEE